MRSHPRHRRRSTRPGRNRLPLLLLAFVGVVAGSLTPMVTDPPAVTAQTQAGTTVSTTVSVNPQPDYVRVGWIDPSDSDGDGAKDCDDADLQSSTCRFSVRDNDEIVFERCAAAAGNAQCVELTATCSAVFDDMRELFDLLDELSVGIERSWDRQIISPGETAGQGPEFKLPEHGRTSQIGLAQLLQAAWPLLPVRWTFLNWDLEFISGVDPNAQTAAEFATSLRTAIGSDYDKIERDNLGAGWRVRQAASAKAQIDTTDVNVNVSPTGLVEWLTEGRRDRATMRREAPKRSRHTGVLYPFPTFTLGALLSPAALATNVDRSAVPGTVDAFAAALDHLTGGKSFNDWVADLHDEYTDGSALEAALGNRLTAQQRAKLKSGDSTKVQEVIDELKIEFDEAANLATRLSRDGGSDVVPYTVRAVLAFLKIVAEDRGNVLNGFGDGRVYEPYLFPFQVLFEAPDLVVGLLELFGLGRPSYRSVRDVTFETSNGITFFEERAESLLLEMRDRCANDLVIQDDRFLRWEDPYAASGALVGDHASARRIEGPRVTGDAVLSTGAPFSVETGPVGAELALTGLSLGETTLWYCYSYAHAGCAEPWTSVTVLVEPAGWDDARVVIQRDHYHIVVDWNADRVLVLRPSPEGRFTLTTGPWTGWSTTGFPDPDELGIRSGMWTNDEHAREYMPDISWRYEIVNAAPGPQDPASVWSFEVELPVMDNDEVHFYDKDHRNQAAGPTNELNLLGVPNDKFITCDTSRYCEHLGVHLLPNPKIPLSNMFTVDSGDTVDSLTVSVNSRSTALGATQPMFGPGEERVFSAFLLSYCVAALNVSCQNWTDRRVNPNPTKVAGRKQGHCVMATSLEPPAAPNAPRQLTVREWARRTGRPQGEFYFKRAMNNDWGWGSSETYQLIKLRNYECPALDPQNPRLATSPTNDWGQSETSQNLREDDCGTDSSDDANEPQSGTREHSAHSSQKHPIIETPSYTDAETQEYKAYRRFWACLKTFSDETAVVAKYHLTHNRAAHPTDRSVLVTMEFINPTVVDDQYPDPDDIADAGIINAYCATEFRPTEWNDPWIVDPGVANWRAIPDEWCYPLAPCWNSDGAAMWNRASLTDEDLDEAGCPHKVGGTVGNMDGTDITPCASFEDALGLRVDRSLTNACSPAAAANFALFEGCVRPSFAAVPRAGDGVLVPGHQRWVTPDHSGSFTKSGAFISRAGRGPADPGLPLFSVSSTVTIDPVWLFCQDAEMDVVGIWPTHPGQTADNLTPNDTSDDYQPWPGDPGPCDANGPTPIADQTASDAEPRFEIDLVCERSYPRLYDTDRDPRNGIILPPTWTNRLKDVVPCVGVVECETWTIPEPGFYRVRVMVDAPEVAKTGAAQTVAANAPANPASALEKARTLGWGALGVGADAASTTVTDPEPFVFDKIIWAQPLFARAG